MPLPPARGRSRPRRLALTTALAALLGTAALAPASALADRIAVDDDRAQCPAADYTSLTAAVAGAAQGDVITICAGTYTVPGGAASPGLRIEKNLTLRGEGADKVFVQPDVTDTSVTSMAAATPSPRDELGNVITVRRRVIELFKVEISGLTVRAYRPDGRGVGVEAGIALVDVTGAKLSGVRVTGLTPATGPGTGPYTTPSLAGTGIVVANTHEATTSAVTIENSLVEGFNREGILLDGRPFDGGTPTANAGSVRATIAGTRIAGRATGTPAIAQSGIVVDSGPCLKLTRSEIVDHRDPAAAPGTSAGVLLKGAGTAPRCGAEWPTVLGGTAALGNAIAGNTFGVYHGDATGALAPTTLPARGNWWGSGGGDPVTANVDDADELAAAPKPLVVPAPAADAAPTLVFDALRDGDEVEVGDAVVLDAIPEDDFGIRAVVYQVGGRTIASYTKADPTRRTPYAATWVPTAADAGREHPVTAAAIDSAGKVVLATVNVRVKALPAGPQEPEPPVDPGTPGEPQAPAPAQPQPQTPAAVTTTAPSQSPFVVPKLGATVLAARKGLPRLRLTLDRPGAVSATLYVSVKRGGRTTKVRVGLVRVKLKAAGTRDVSVRLTATGRSLIRKSGRLKVTVELRALWEQKLTTATQTLTLRIR